MEPYEQMSSGRHSFKLNDTTRLVKAVEAAGKKICGVMLDRGKVTVLVDESGRDAAAVDISLDTWMEKHADKASRG
jgi:hypothetical protein